MYVLRVFAVGRARPREDADSSSKLTPSTDHRLLMPNPECRPSDLVVCYEQKGVLLPSVLATLIALVSSTCELRLQRNFSERAEGLRSESQEKGVYMYVNGK